MNGKQTLATPTASCPKKSLEASAWDVVDKIVAKSGTATLADNGAAGVARRFYYSSESINREMTILARATESEIAAVLPPVQELLP